MNRHVFSADRNCRLLAVVIGTLLTPTVHAGAFTFADAGDPDSVTHPAGYQGSSTTLTVHVCVDSSSANRNLMEVPTQNVVATWNGMNAVTGNARENSPDVPGNSALDFESVLLHEMGHCNGLAHPNIANGTDETVSDSTQSAGGSNGVLNINAGADGVHGSRDDQRGDDINLHWFRRSDNNPFLVDANVNQSNYSINLSDLPGGSNFAENADRDVGALRGFPNTEAVMNQLTFTDEEQRELQADDVSTRRLANSGFDRNTGGGDDYTLTLNYVGQRASNDPECDIMVDFDNSQTGFAVCAISGFGNPNGDVTISSGRIYFNTGSNWHFNQTPKQGSGNLSPTANNDSASIAEDSSNASINLTGNDSDPDGDALSVTSVSNFSAGGSASFTNDAALYTPAANFFGTETFTYTISDGNGGTDSALVTVTVTNVNDPPTATNDSFAVPENTSGNVFDVLGNDSIAPDSGESLSVTAVGSAANGSASVSPGNQDVTYTPNPGFVGGDSFSYSISDGNGGTAMAMVSVTVNNVNDNPVAQADSFTVDEDSTTSIDVLINDSDPDPGQTLSIVAIGSLSAGGSASISGGGSSIIYSPAANFFGTESFSYTVSDGAGGIGGADVTITVNPVNDNPGAQNDAFTVAEDSSNNTLNVLANDSSAPDTGETLVIASLGPTSNGGTVTGVGAASLSYTPATDFNGIETFSYTISDGNGGSAMATVTITVTNDNLNPTANNDAFSVDEDSQNSSFDVLANDSDPDAGQLLTISGVSGFTSGGAASIIGGNSLSYTPAPNFSGTETFSYSIADGDGGADSATVTVSVNGINDDPTAANDAASVQEGSSNTLINVLNNDSSAPDSGETLSITSLGTPSQGGTVSIVGSSVRYTPAANFTGTETFTYTISDGNGGSATATVTVGVSEVNVSPDAQNDAFSVPEDSINFSLDVLDNDSDPNAGQNLTITAVVGFNKGGRGQAGQNGTVLLYSPAAHFVGTETFGYEISDGAGGVASAVVTVTVTNVNDNPVAVDDNFTVLEDSSDVSLPVLTNDNAGPDSGESINILSVGTPSRGGRALLSADETIRYTPSNNFSGTETFSYTISDGNSGSASALVTVSVSNVNDPPTATSIADQSINEGASFGPFNVSSNFTDVDQGDSLSFSLEPAAETGGLAIASSSGVITGTPSAGAGDYEIFVTARDTAGAAAVSHFTLRINSDGAPSISPISDVTIDEDSASTARPFTVSDSQTAGAQLQVTATSGDLELLPAGGIALAGSGSNRSIRLTPAANAFGETTVTVAVSDGAQTTSTDFQLIVNPVNDAPVLSPVAAQSTAEDQPVSFQIVSTDIDSSPVDYSFSGSSSNAALVDAGGFDFAADAESITVTVTPKSNATGTATLTINVVDGPITESLQVSLQVSNSNDAPILTSPIDDLIAAIGEAVTRDLSANFSDPEGDVISYTASGLPAGFSLSSNGQLSGSFTSATANGSPYIVTVTATDNTGAASSADFTLATEALAADFSLVAGIDPALGSSGTALTLRVTLNKLSTAQVTTVIATLRIVGLPRSALPLPGNCNVANEAAEAIHIDCSVDPAAGDTQSIAINVGSASPGDIALFADVAPVGNDDSPENNADAAFARIASRIDTAMGLTLGTSPVTDAAIADLDADGRADVVLAVQGNAALQIFYGANGGFETAVSAGSPASYQQVILDDIDGDGLVDLFAATASSVRSFRNLGARSFGSGFSAGNLNLGTARLADADADGDLDVLIAGPDGIAFLRSSLAKTLTAERALSTDPASALGSGDLDGDGVDDLVVGLTNGGLRLYRGTGGNPAFQIAQVRNSLGSIHDIAVRDLDADGLADFVLARGAASGNVDALSNLVWHSLGNFQIEQLAKLGNQDSRRVDIADVDGNGTPDLLFADQDSGLAIYINNGAAAFQASSSVLGEPGIQDLAAGQLDSDEDIDLVLLRSAQAGALSVFNDGNAGFGEDSGGSVGAGGGSDNDNSNSGGGGGGSGEIPLALLLGLGTILLMRRRKAASMPRD